MKMSSLIDRPRCIAFASTKDRRSMEQLFRSMERASQLTRQGAPFRHSRLRKIRGETPPVAGVWGGLEGRHPIERCCRWRRIPGTWGQTFPYAGGIVRYREICANVAEHGYDGFALS
jgi:hypothetical protein